MESGHFFGCNVNSNMLVFGSAVEYFRDNMEEASTRRHFLSSLDDMLEEEFYGQSPEKKRRLSLQQAHMLEMSFEKENKLEPERKTELAKNLGLQPRQVAVWFQNRRARWKTKTLQRDYDRLKSSYDALLSDFDSILKDNEILKSQVASLTETLQAPGISTTGQSSDASPAEVPPPSTVGNTEDGFRTGSGGNTVVDGGDSYFPNYDYFGGCVAPADQSEDDGGSDDGRSLFAAAAEQRELVEEETMGWWVWS